MISVDSSVWIEFLARRRSVHQEHLSALIQLPEAVRIPGPVIQEVLQGIQERDHVLGSRWQACAGQVVAEVQRMDLVRGTELLRGVDDELVAVESNGIVELKKKTGKQEGVATVIYVSSPLEVGDRLKVRE